MESKLIRSKTYTSQGDDTSPGFKTRYFPDGSAIIVTEKSITLVESVARYKLHPRGKEPEQSCGLLAPPADLSRH